MLFAVRFFVWLCCEHLQRVCCKIEEVVFLICRCFFYLQHVELSRPPYNCFSLVYGGFSFFMFFFLFSLYLEFGSIYVHFGGIFAPTHVTF